MCTGMCFKHTEALSLLLLNTWSEYCNQYHHCHCKQIVVVLGCIMLEGLQLTQLSRTHVQNRIDWLPWQHRATVFFGAAIVSSTFKNAQPGNENQQSIGAAAFCGAEKLSAVQWE